LRWQGHFLISGWFFIAAKALRPSFQPTISAATMMMMAHIQYGENSSFIFALLDSVIVLSLCRIPNDKPRNSEIVAGKRGSPPID